MIRNYLTSALRNLLQHKLYAMINIGGLAIGLAAAILILLFVRDEFSWDSWVPGAERIFRVELQSFPAGREPVKLAASFTPLAPFYSQGFKEVRQATRLRYQARTFEHDGRHFAERPGFVDSNFLEVFELDMLQGEAVSALRDPTSVVISESTARKYFGRWQVLGESLSLNNGESYRITGVFADLPVNSHLDLDILLQFNYSAFPEQPGTPSILDDWFNLGTYVYLLLDRPESGAIVQAGMPQLLNDHGPRPRDTTIPSGSWSLQLVNIRDIHLDGAPRARIKPAGSRSGAIIFASVAMLILLIGCLNFINLSTAKATLRTREVAVRKVFGASRRQLFTQFLLEVGLVVLLALGLALVLVEAAMPWYNGFIQKMLALDLVRDPVALAGLAGLLLIVILGAGSHPALTISALRPVDVLKSGRSQGAHSSKVRSVLVGIQFAIAITLIISSSIVYSQVQHGLNRDKGYQHENMLVVGKINDPKVADKAEELKNRLLAHPEISSAALSSATPADTFTTMVEYGAINGVRVEPVMVNFISIDADFFSNYQVSFLAGRDFDRERAADYSSVARGEYRDSSVIISESAMRKLGLASPQEAIGAVLAEENKNTVVGVVADIHNGSARDQANPFIYLVDQPEYRRLSLSYETDDLQALLAEVDRIWTDIVPDVPLSTSILEEDIEAGYEDEKTRGLMFAIFAALAITVASLGLYGLSSFTVEQRTREIGMRKVLGAPIHNIVSHFAWQSTRPVIWANLLAWPIAWYFMANWLEGFSYRIELTPLPFLLAGGLAYLIGMAAVVAHVWLAARTNPIQALRYE
jgi:putative ABC transport system permease protein